MSLSCREQRLLGEIDDAECRSDPRLASQLAIFGQLNAGEEMPSREQLRTPPLSRFRAAMLRAAAVITRTAVACARGIRSAAVACAAVASGLPGHRLPAAGAASPASPATGTRASTRPNQPRLSRERSPRRTSCEPAPTHRRCHLIRSRSSAPPRCHLIRSRSSAPPRCHLIRSRSSAPPRCHLIRSRSSAPPRCHLIRSRSSAPPRCHLIRSRSSVAPRCHPTPFQTLTRHAVRTGIQPGLAAQRRSPRQPGKPGHNPARSWPGTAAPRR